MIKTFNTPAIPGQGSSSGTNTFLILLGLGVAAFLVYKYVIKPAQEKEKQPQTHA